MDLSTILAKEALVIVFRAFPGQFVLVGGGALHWIFHSPRFSVDLDLKPVQPPSRGLLKQMAVVLTRHLSPVGLPLGVLIRCEADPKGNAVRVTADGKPVLHVEL